MYILCKYMCTCMYVRMYLSILRIHIPVPDLLVFSSMHSQQPHYSIDPIQLNIWYDIELGPVPHTRQHP